MRFKELYKKTLLGTTKVKVLELAETDEDGYTATPVMSCISGDKVPKRVYNAELVHVWPREDKLLVVVISGETKLDKNYSVLHIGE